MNMNYTRDCIKCNVAPRLTSKVRGSKFDWFYICPKCGLSGDKVVSISRTRRFLSINEMNQIVKCWNDALGVDFVYVKKELLNLSNKKNKMIEELVVRPMSVTERDILTEELKRLFIREKSVMNEYIDFWSEKKKDIEKLDAMPSVCDCR